VILSGDSMDVRNDHGEAVKDETFMMLFNAFHDPMSFVLAGKQDINWELIINTKLESGFVEPPTTHSSGDELEMAPRSMAVLRLVKGSQEDARNVSWRRSQKAEPTAPPVPPRQKRTFRDATTADKAPVKPSGAKEGDGGVLEKIRDVLPGAKKKDE
jgi:glycogen operon protein